MDDRFLTPSRLEMLRQVTLGVGSASTIAKESKISLPYVLTQLQLLEAKGFIKKTKTRQQTGPGKPKTSYVLASPFAHLLLAKEGFCEKVVFSQAPPSMLLYLQLTSFVTQHLSIFSQYFWRNANEFLEVTALAKIEFTDTKIEFLAIAEQNNLEELRKKISNKRLKNEKGEEVEVVTWVHTIKEITEGLARHDFYYTNLRERMSPLVDPKEVLREITHRE